MTPLIAALIALALQFAILLLDLMVGWCFSQKMQLSFQDIQSVNFVECVWYYHSIGTTPWPSCASVIQWTDHLH